MQFVRVAKVRDFRNIRIKSFEILGKHVAVVKEPDGTFYATEISCKHQNADLTKGEFRGDIVTCHRHGWKYNIRTGECLNQPSSPLRRHRLRLQGDDILVSVTAVEPEPAKDEEDWMPEVKINRPEERG